MPSVFPGVLTLPTTCHFTSIFDLAFDAISKFNPSRLGLPIRRVSSRSSTDPAPEVQYRDEFYRSVFSSTCGNVCLSPEFVTAKRARGAGRIDFFIPVVKWGIELTQDGSGLEELSSRFAKFGVYDAWLKSGGMDDYILLDCRTSIPTEKYQSTDISLK
jgi:hypothetical protein